MKAIAQMEKDLVSEVLGTGYMRFTSATGIHGLCKATGPMLELLAVEADRPGHGQFREFIKAAKADFETIKVWHVWNDGLANVLDRYGFRPCRERQIIDGHSEEISGFRFDRVTTLLDPRQNPPPLAGLTPEPGVSHKITPGSLKQ